MNSSTKNLDPRIGQLAGGQYYAFVDGPDEPVTIGDLEQVEYRLGLRAKPEPKGFKIPKPRQAGQLVHDYLVIITTAAGQSYEFEALFTTRAQAISEARQWLKDETAGERAMGMAIGGKFRARIINN